MLEKNLKKIKVFIIIVLAILISLIAFFGAFKFDKGVWNNIVPDYEYGMDVAGNREIRYDVDQTESAKYVYVDENGNIVGEVWKDGNNITAEDEAASAEEGQAEEENAVQYAKETRLIKENPDEVLTPENFESVKKIIQKRLDEQNITEYVIRVDDVTGKLTVETSNDNEVVETVENLLGQVGKFKIVDYQNGVELMNNSDIKDVSVVYSNTSSYNTYLQIEFNKQGAQKLREMSKEYVEIKEEKAETTENSETEEASQTEEDADEETTKKYVSIVLDDSTLMTTYFGEEMTQGILQIPVGNGTSDTKQFLENQSKAKLIATVLNSGIFPVKYNIETDNFVKSEITQESVKIAKVVMVIAIVLASIYFVIRYKLKGLIAGILSIGFIALFTLVLRYTNVQITLNSIVAIVFVAIMNYLFINMFLSKMKENKSTTAIFDALKRFYLNTIPVSVIAIVFTFATSVQISSIGMSLFWGMVLIALYNIIFTKSVFKNLENK